LQLDIQPISDLRSLLGRHRHGPYDPTSALSATDFWQAARTPDGPGVLHISVRLGQASAAAYGVGEAWLMAQVPRLLGQNDVLPPIVAQHDAVRDALHRFALPRMSASGLVMPNVLAAVLGQRVTSGEAISQWSSLCRLDSQAAPGPADLLLPPDPAVLATTPTWRYHRLGIERARADTIINLCRRANRVEEVATMSLADGYQRLMAFRGVGLWTAAVTMSACMGDPDAVPVGDFHMKNIVSYALAGEPRGTDERMLELLSPYAGQRGRVLELLLSAGWNAPKFGPRQAIQSFTNW
jgi:3-methyladenine DNA glycosylase/8-oxoguanine DNA glycosylase